VSAVYFHKTSFSNLELFHCRTDVILQSLVILKKNISTKKNIINSYIVSNYRAISLQREEIHHKMFIITWHQSDKQFFLNFSRKKTLFLSAFVHMCPHSRNVIAPDLKSLCKIVVVVTLDLEAKSCNDWSGQLTEVLKLIWHWTRASGQSAKILEMSE
jgi:hypothetical protein